MLKITEIKINHIREPKGITDHLSIGWALKSDHRNVVQRGYCIQIALDEDYKEIIYDTGSVVSEQSQNIEIHLIYLLLKSVCSYRVRVKAWDNYDETSDWSESSFLTGLLGEDQWQADFITAEQPEDRSGSKATMLRREFVIKKPVKEAFLLSTAHGLYQTFMNGERVGNDELTPGWTDYKKRVLYQTYEVTGQLVTGVNVWSALVGVGWYKGDITYHRIHNYYGDYAEFSGELILRYEDGSEEMICTDHTWKGADSPILHSDIYDGEVYDARLETDEWKRAGITDNNWRSVKVTAQKRGQLVPQSGSPVQIKEILEAKRILVTPNGEQVLDFGQNISGWVQFQVTGNLGDVVELVCFEMLDHDGNVYVENLRTAKQTIRYICKGIGTEEYHPHFTFQGFQYVWVKQHPGEIAKESFNALVLYSDMDETGTFSCSNPLLNRLQSNIMWGLKGNSVDIPSDCPQRDERLGWTGDVQVFCNTACYLLNMYEFYRKWLGDLAAEQQESGAVTNVVPDVLSRNEPDHFCGAAGWGDVAVVLPWILYQETGDKAIIKQQYDSMRSWIDFVYRHVEDGIYSYGLQFGDWVALDAEEGSYHGATPSELTSAAYFAYATDLFSKMAADIGKTDDAEKYRKMHEETVHHFQDRYFSQCGEMVIKTQTAHVLALSFQLTPEKYRQQTVRELLLLLKQRDMHLTTGFLGTPYLAHALSENGCLNEAYELLMKKDFPSWLYQVEQGATTVWEHWDGLKPDGTMWSADMNSFNHYAYGSIGKWLYEVCAGLKRDEHAPGYKHFYIEPNPGGNLQYAKTTHHSGYGEIVVGWKKEGLEYILDVEIPPNTTATILLPVTDSRPEGSGLEFIESGGRYTAKAGSGDYEIHYKIE